METEAETYIANMLARIATAPAEWCWRAWKYHQGSYNSTDLHLMLSPIHQAFPLAALQQRMGELWDASGLIVSDSGRMRPCTVEMPIGDLSALLRWKLFCREWGRG